MRRIYAAVIFMGVFVQPFNTMAQSNLQELLKGSVADANRLLEGYIGPGMRGLGSGLNQGWYNTASVHKPLGVDFTISTSLMYVPSSDDYYTVNNNKLQSVKLVSIDGQPVGPTESAKVPTIFGPAKTPQYQIAPFNPFDGPPGLDLKNTIKIANALPVPIYHLGIGLPKSFELKIRWAPTLETKDYRFSLFGIGVMHDVKQYIKAIKSLPFDLSAFIGYTHMDMELAMTGSGIVGANLRAVAQFNSTTIQALISKKISVVTFYGALGYNIAKSSLDMKGTYDMNDDGIPETKNPVNLDFSTSGARISGGLKLKLAIFTFHGDYTLSKYNAFTAGFGIAVR